MRKIKILFFISFLYATASAQETSDCSKVLKRAQKIYDTGEIEKVEGTLSECLESGGFTNAEKTEALKMIILCNLFDDNILEAEKNMISLLKTNPDFVPKPTDHQELKELYKKFRIDPLWIIDFMGGVNFTYGYLLQDYTLDHYSPDLNNESSYSKYKSKLGINAGFQVNYLIKNLWRIQSGFTYRTQNFSTNDSYNVKALGSDSAQQISEAEVSTTLLEVPLGITKEFGRKNIVPHIGFGGAVTYLIGSNHLLERTYLIDGAAAPATGTAVSTLSQNQNLNFVTYLKTGLRYKIGLRGKVILDVKFNFGLLNQTSEDNRYSNSELIYKYYFVPDDFLLHNLSFNVGYSQLLYKPKKLKNK